MTACALIITFTSDWQIGTGAARHASVDRTVRRDTDGLPYLPGKTLRGLLRQGCAQAAHALDDGENGEWSKLHTHLFGMSGRDGLLVVPSARLSPEVRSVLKQTRELREATVLLRAATALDQNGRARQDTLRLEERARQGAVLSAMLTVESPEAWLQDNEWAVLLLLYAGARLVTRIGGKRRRGAGRVTLAVAPPIWDADRVANYIFARPSPPAPDPIVEDASETIGWHHYWLTLTTQEPILVADRTLGNVVTGRRYVPGSLLLPFLTSAVGEKIRAAVAAGEFVVTDATPYTGDARRGLPTPRSLQIPKLGEDLVVDTMRREPPDAVQYKRLGGYVVDAADPTTLDNLPGTVAITHVNVAAESGPFTFEALQPGSSLRAEIWSRAPLDLDLLPKSARIGTARRTEYGEVAFETQSAAVEPTRHLDDLVAEGTIVLWLTSDLLLPLAPPTSTAITRALETELGAILRLEHTALGTVRRDPWHGRWGLAQPSQEVVEAGSTFRFTVVRGTVHGDDLERLEREGLGVRRAEGYGRVLFNPPLLSQDDAFRARTTQAVATTRVDEAGAAIADEFLASVRAAAARAAINEAALIAVQTSLTDLLPRWPGDAAAGGLRRAVEGLTGDGGLEAARIWVTKVRDSHLRSGAWQQAHLVALTRWFTDPSTFVAEGAPGADAYHRVARLLDTAPDEVWVRRILQRLLLLALATTRAARVREKAATKEVTA